MNRRSRAVVSFASVSLLSLSASRNAGAQTCDNGSGVCLTVENTSTTGGGGLLAQGDVWAIYANTGTTGTNGQNGILAASKNGSGNGTGVLGTATGGTGVYGVDYGSGVGAEGYSDNGNGVFGESYGANGVVGQTGSTSAGVWGNNTGGGTGVAGNTTGSGYAIAGTNTNSSGFAGWFDGNVKITGNLTITGSCSGCSDLRLKQNVRPLNGAIDQLLQLKGVTFEWKDPSTHGHENETGTVTGFIAQDVEKVFPQWVHEKGYTAPDGQTYRTLELRQIEALEVESIRELKAENDALKRRMDLLEAGRRPLISGFTAEGTLFGVGFVAMAGTFVGFSRRKKQDERS